MILKYRRAAAYFRDLLQRRRAATSIARWYRLKRDRNQFTSMKKAEKVVKVGGLQIASSRKNILLGARPECLFALWATDGHDI